MSIFNEFLPKLNEISKDYIKNFNNDLEAVFQCFDKFEEDYRHGKSRAREKVPKDKNLTTLQSINETEDESTKTPENEKPSRRSSTKSKSTDEGSSSLDSNGERRGSKKRSKNEVDGISSPEQDKRQKRNASVKAQSIITKQANETTKVLEETSIINLDTPKRGVNVNLTQKLRREEPAEKSRRRRPKDDEKENAEPAPIVPLVQVKQEKISLPPEPMEMESLPLDIEVKKEMNKDEIAMPPPAVPVPKPRKAVQKEKSEESSAEEDSGNNKRRTTRTRKQTDTMPPPPEPRKAVQKEKSEESSAEEDSGNKRRTTRTRKQTDTMPPQPVAASRATRASSRATRRTESEEQPEPRPKRTRAKKKAESESSNADTEKENQAPQENGIGSPAEKPRPKRTRRGQKAAEKEEVQKPLEKPVETVTEPPLQEKPVETITESLLKEKPVKATTEPPLKEERITQEVVHSPIIQQKTKITKKPNRTKTKDDDMDSQSKINLINDTTKTIIAPDTLQESALAKNLALEETRIIAKDSTAANGNGDMDKTVVLPNGVYNHAPVTPKVVRAMNETVVLDKNNRETIVLDKPKNAIMDATVVIEKDTKQGERLTDDNSLLTDDSDYKDPCTPPQPPPATQPTSAVKEKVQQFEEMATRVTRTKTRAMAKKQDTQAESETQTPPDKVSKPVLSAETLQKMDSLIFNGKVPQISSSATKPKATTTTQAKLVTSSASKLSGINKAREAEDQRNEREDARRKKEAMLEAKRELQKRKREEKMAAAAASRSQAERERRAAMQAAARERLERQAHADHGRLLRLREVEKRKQELARKVAETEERRRAEETARQQRLADEQRRAELARRKQIEEAEAMKKEAAIMAREIEKRQKEYIERQKMKQRMEGEKISTPLKLPGTPTGYPPMEPVYMSDGFQYLNSDEDDEPVERPVPAWSTSKARRQHLYVQARVAPALVERLFAVRTHSPDLRAIFPDIERARLKRTSSAVWRTPPRLPVVKE